MSSTEPLLSIRGVSKAFEATQALDGVDLDVNRGEILGLMGPNGAGKSTLIRILDGVYSPDSGTIAIDGQRVTTLRGNSSVGFVHQDLGLIDELPISANLRLGQPAVRRLGPYLNLRREQELARSALDGVRMRVDPRTLVGDLSPGEKTLVAIARARSRGASLLIVDEATSTLPPGDAEMLLQTLQAIAEQGGGVIMVTHKLNEILDAADRVVLLIDGRIAGNQGRTDLDRSKLVELLLKHDTAFVAEEAETSEGEARITLRDACTLGCGPVDLELRAGEVVGLTGLPGSGLHDIAYLAAGAVAPESGAVEIRGDRLPALVPPHRETQGGFPDLSVATNMTISSLSRWTDRGKLLRPSRERRAAEEVAAELDLRPPDVNAPFETLSGGNKQKVIIGRAILRESPAFVLCEPTRGIDIGTRFEIYKLIRELRSQGAAILVASSDSEDLFAVCDRVGVVRDGLVSRVHEIQDLEPSELEALV